LSWLRTLILSPQWLLKLRPF